MGSPHTCNGNKLWHMVIQVDNSEAEILHNSSMEDSQLIQIITKIKKVFFVPTLLLLYSFTSLVPTCIGK